MPADDDHLDTPIWGAREIAKEIGRSENTTYILLTEGFLPARRVHGRWCTTKRRLRQFFSESKETAA